MDHLPSRESQVSLLLVGDAQLLRLTPEPTHPKALALLDFPSPADLESWLSRSERHGLTR